jgi:hypothetical protein
MLNRERKALDLSANFIWDIFKMYDEIDLEHRARKLDALISEIDQAAAGPAEIKTEAALSILRKWMMQEADDARFKVASAEESARRRD